MVGKEDAMGGGDIAYGYHLMKRNRREKKRCANDPTPRIRTCVAAAARSEMETLAQQSVPGTDGGLGNDPTQNRNAVKWQGLV